MNPSINSLLGPLEAATRQGSWEDVEDIAGEISRLARLQRLSELKRLESALAEKFKTDIRDDRKVKIAPEGSQGAKTPLQANLSDRFSTNHDEDWRNQVAGELNCLLAVAGLSADKPIASAARSIVARVAHFEEIMVERD